MTTPTSSQQTLREDRCVLRLSREPSPVTKKRADKDSQDDDTQANLADRRACQALVSTALENRNGAVANPLRDVEWVYANLAVPWTQVEAGSVPSTGAVALLSAAKDNPRWFLDKLYLKLVPIPTEIVDDYPEDEDDLDAAELIAASGLLNDEELRNLGLSNDRPVTSP